MVAVSLQGYVKSESGLRAQQCFSKLFGTDIKLNQIARRKSIKQTHPRVYIQGVAVPRTDDKRRTLYWLLTEYIVHNRHKFINIQNQTFCRKVDLHMRHNIVYI